MLCFAAWTLPGCGSASGTNPAPAKKPPPPVTSSVTTKAQPPAPRPEPPAEPTPAATPTTNVAAAPAPPVSAPTNEEKLSKEELERRRNLADVLFGENELIQPTKIQTLKPPPQHDDARLAAAGVRKLFGKHVVLYTDLPASPEVDELPRVFDLAVPQWRDYFGAPAADVERWKLTGYLIGNPQTFRALGLVPADLPPFLHGYQRDYEFWLNDQPSAYYRRHLLLHEGTHGFMNVLLGGSGPPWYMEGMAELLGTHRWENGQLQLRYFPKTNEDVPYWGRVKIIRDGVVAGKALNLIEVMKFGPNAHLQVEPYAWCWAAAAFFDGHPRYQPKFRQLIGQVKQPDAVFSKWFYEQLADQWPTIAEEWQLFILDLDYGYDLARAAVEFKPGQSPAATGTIVTVAADRGWQSSGVRLEANTTYQVQAAGRYQIGKEPQIWWCEPNGVTLRYYRGRPLGMLLAALRDDAGMPLNAPPGAVSPLANPVPIGPGMTFTPQRPGTLYLKINEFSGDLADNAGNFQVRVLPK